MSDPELVPDNPPFGGPTPSDLVCMRCGDNRTGCALCAGEAVRLTQIDTRLEDERARILYS